MIDIEIKRNEDCMGCYACNNICPVECISMDSDSEGFWYPSVDYNKCTKCGLCIKVCPIINKLTVQNKPKAYACINNNDDVRLESSSGGIFTLLAEDIIDNGGVVFGAAFDNSFSLIHKYVETKEELGELKGSKYVQSKIGDIYGQVKRFLKEERYVLFSGTPCQIAGLQSYLHHRYNHLFCVDIVCHGVPSPKIWDKYVQFREDVANSKATQVKFRNKSEGWRQYSISFLFENWTEYRETLDTDIYMQAFLKNISLRPSCYACQFKTLHRQSDITLADFWGVQDMLPEMDDDKGTSLIFINSNNGQLMMEKFIDKVKFKTNY